MPATTGDHCCAQYSSIVITDYLRPQAASRVNNKPTHKLFPRCERSTASSVECAMRILPPTLHHPSPSLVGNRTNGCAAERPRRIAAPVRVVACLQSTLTNNTFPGRDRWGTKQSSKSPEVYGRRPVGGTWISKDEDNGTRWS